MPHKFVLSPHGILREFIFISITNELPDVFILTFWKALPLATKI